MIIPNVFQEKDRPTLDETVIDLMESIAQEELALSNLINSEAKKINAFVGKRMDFPSCPTSLEILEFNQSINKIMDTVLMKEWLLLRKLETVINIKSKLEGLLREEGNNRDCKSSKYYPHCVEDKEFMEQRGPFVFEQDDDEDSNGTCPCIRDTDDFDCDCSKFYDEEEDDLSHKCSICEAKDDFIDCDEEDE